MKCKICNKRIKENTYGDGRYCQGHSIFEEKNTVDKTKEKEIEVMLKLSQVECEILDIIYNVDEFTTSDLQGAIGAQVKIAYLMGKNEEK